MSLFRRYLRYARGESSPMSPFSLLAPFGLMFGAAAWIRDALYRRGIIKSEDPSLPVISVGNLCHGGTNKTPAVVAIARALDGAGLTVGVLSRGYGGSARTATIVSRPGAGISASRAVVGDEPMLIASHLDRAIVAVSPDRLAGVDLLRENGADIVVADDAFQHRRMARDADIVLVDATCPFGSGRYFPAGILRESPSSLARADIVVLTKTEQINAGALDALKRRVAEYVPADSIFTARMELSCWIERDGGRTAEHGGAVMPPEWRERRCVAFSAIASPESFERTLISAGANVGQFVHFRDHRAFSASDLRDLAETAQRVGATALVCTEKDLQNLPSDVTPPLPLIVPRISFALADEASFYAALARSLEPWFVVTSNGHGEDSIGSLLARRIKDRFPAARVSAFPLVGQGKEYAANDIEVLSPSADRASGGVVKYSLRELLSDIREGLGSEIATQIKSWRGLNGHIRTPICVGDVYLLLMALWGHGMTPALIATAKSSLTNGHMYIERALLRRRARAVWTRDATTARDLAAVGVDARFCGSPIMDLAHSEATRSSSDPWQGMTGHRVMLLPGSRTRAYDDIDMLISAVEIMASREEIACLMVLAPTIDKDKLASDSSRRARIDALVRVFDGPVGAAARGAEILIGLGGTANQVCAGMGIPIVSVMEKGKLAQKKLLRDAEVLVDPTPEALANEALAVLDDRARYDAMSSAGVRMLGGPGAIDAAVEFAAHDLGWDARCHAYGLMSDKFLRAHCENIQRE